VRVGAMYMGVGVRMSVAMHFLALGFEGRRFITMTVTVAMGVCVSV
jgi:hypothetical protein